MAVDRRSFESRREAAGARLILNQHPGNENALDLRPGPFEIGERDAADRAVLDERDEVRVAKGIGIALDLKKTLALPHGIGCVDGENELEVDCGALSRSGYR